MSISVFAPPCVAPEDDRFISRKEAASILGFSAKTIDRLDADRSPTREFPPCYVITMPGRTRAIRRWRLSEVHEYMRRMRRR
jgi:predicted DNA-binding transcriptional regulator AlpA